MREPQNFARRAGIQRRWTGAAVTPAEGCFVHRSTERRTVPTLQNRTRVERGHIRPRTRSGRAALPTLRQGATHRHIAPLQSFHAVCRTQAPMTCLLKIVSLARDAGSRDGTVDGGKGAPAGARDTGSSGWCTRSFAQIRQRRSISRRGRTVVNAETLLTELRRRTDPRFRALLKQDAHVQPAHVSSGAAHE